MALTYLVIYGAGGHGRETAWLAESCSAAGEHYQVACFVDDDPSLQGTTVNRIQVLSLEEACSRFPEARVVGGVGSPHARQRMMEKAAQLGFGFATLVHPGVERSTWIEVGAGTVICAGCIITVNVRLGRHVQINVGCTVAHDVVMSDYATLAPGVHVCGAVHLGQRAYIGAGAVIINGTPEQPLVIGENAVIGAGACVTRSVPAGQTVGGVPARVLVQDR